MKTVANFMYWGLKTVRIAVLLLLVLALLAGAAVPAAGLAKESARPAAQSPEVPPTVIEADELPGKKIEIKWVRVDSAAKYRLYRSLVQGTYTPADLIHTHVVSSQYDWLTYTDTFEGNGIRTYYYVVTVVDAQGLESVYSNEVTGLPHYRMDWTGMVWVYLPDDLSNPLASSFTYTLGNPSERPVVMGEVYIQGRTGQPQPEPDIWAQFGFSPAGDDPSSEIVDLTAWTNWQDAVYHGNGAWAAANSRYKVEFVPEKTGNYYFNFRFSTTGGRDWVYAGYMITFSDPTQVNGDLLGRMSIVPNPDDIISPEAPTLSVVGHSGTQIQLAWTASESEDVYAYDLYRSTGTTDLGQMVKVGRWLDTGEAEFSYTDENLVGGTQYYYRLVTLDRSFNASQSDPVCQRTDNNPVTFTLNVIIPEITPGTVYMNRVYDAQHYLLGDEEVWTGIPLDCEYAARLCTVELSIQQNAEVSFKFSRGSPETVQTQVDGNTPAIDPSFTVVCGMTTVNRIISNWEDPLVTKISPQAGASGVSPRSGISITWNQDMPIDTSFLVRDLGKDGSKPGAGLSGDFLYDSETYTLTFFPAEPLKATWFYQVEVSGQYDKNQPPVLQQVDRTWSFSTSLFETFLPVIRR